MGKIYSGAFVVVFLGSMVGCMVDEGDLEGDSAARLNEGDHERVAGTLDDLDMEVAYGDLEDILASGDFAYSPELSPEQAQANEIRAQELARALGDGCFVLDFNVGGGGRQLYVEDGMHIRLKYPFYPGGVLISGGALWITSFCCGSPYRFQMGDGSLYTIKSMDVVSLGMQPWSSPSRMSSDRGGTKFLRRTGRVDFPGKRWTGIQWLDWRSPLPGSARIDNIVICSGDGNQPPVADAGDDQTLECTGALTDVTLDGSGSHDPDGDPLSYLWTGSFGSASGEIATVALNPDSHEITLTVDDGQGGSDTDEVIIDIVDTAAPQATIELHADNLWPPNHTMHRVATVSAADVCDPDASLAISVTSDEPIDGPGDGHTEPDWEIVDNGDGSRDVLVRAERSGLGDGRVYTISAVATDASGNTSASVSAQVTVAHDRS